MSNTLDTIDHNNKRAEAISAVTEAEAVLELLEKLTPTVQASDKRMWSLSILGPHKRKVKKLHKRVAFWDDAPSVAAWVALRKTIKAALDDQATTKEALK